MEHSESIKEISKALCKAHSEMGPVKRNCNNPFYNSNYADLANVLEAVRKPLSDNGLTLVQAAEMDDGKAGVTTLLMHDSGEWIKSSFKMTPKDASNPQVIGSLLTYMKRYSVPGYALIASEDDDDGNAASETKEEVKKEPNKDPEASAGQVKYMQTLFSRAKYQSDSDRHSYASQVAKREIKSLKDLTKPEASLVIKSLEALTAT